VGGRDRPAGLTVIATNKQAFDVSPGAEPSIGITATRSPVYSWHDPRLLDRDGVYSYQDQGVQRFSYELVPHAGDWRAAQPTRRAILLGSPVRAMLESSHPGELPAAQSFASDGGDAVLATVARGRVPARRT
jgi:alpha-mannosidase